MSLKLTVHTESLAICQLAVSDSPPDWALSARGLVSITRTARELSVVCPQQVVPPGVQASRGWQALEVAGPLEFDLTGVLANLSASLAQAGISLFAVSTFNTDYLLVRETKIDAAVQALEFAGHTVTR